jgi:hypothetical protein
MAMVMALAVLGVAGCSLLGPRAAPSEPFGDFSLGEFGGIDGRQNIVYVRADGVALRIAAGCHLDRPIDHLISNAGLIIRELETGYGQGPRPFSYLYRGRALPAV